MPKRPPKFTPRVADVAVDPKPSAQIDNRRGGFPAAPMQQEERNRRNDAREASGPAETDPRRRQTTKPS